MAYISLSETPSIKLDVVAEGFHKVVTVPVRVVTLAEWDALSSP
jgi:hypothetical protein